MKQKSKSKNLRIRKIRAEKTVQRIQLLPRLEKYPTVSYYAGILHSPWAGACKSSYDQNATTWNDFRRSLKFYISSPYPVSCIISDFSFSKNVKMFFTRRDGHTILNITLLYYDETYTVNIVFPNSIFTVSTVADCIDEKSSSFVTLCCRSIISSKATYTAEEKEKRKAQILEGGAPQYFAEAFSGNFNLAESKIAVKDYIAAILSPCIFRAVLTLAYIDMALQSGSKLQVNEEGTVYLSTEDILSIESNFWKLPSNIATIPIYPEDNRDISNVIVEGDVENFYNVYGTSPGDKGIIVLKYLSSIPHLNLDRITEESKTGFIYLDENGKVLPTTYPEDKAKAKYLIAPTGLTEFSTLYPIFALYVVEPNGIWNWVMFNTMSELFTLLEETLSKKLFDQDIVTKMCAKDFKIKRSGVRHLVTSSKMCLQDVEYSTAHYECSDLMLEDLSPMSNIKTIEHMDYFINSFIRLLKKRYTGVDGTRYYNTGLRDKQGRWMYIRILNLKLKPSEIQPIYVRGQAANLQPDTFFTNSRALVMQVSDNGIKYDVNSIYHSLWERQGRMPAHLANMTITDFTNALKFSVDYALENLKVDPFFAQPCFLAGKDRVTHMIPLYFRNDTGELKMEAVLIIRDSYVVTMYSVSMARKNACLFQIPIASWLDVA